MKINQKGMSLAEVIVSLLMVTLIMFAAIAFMTGSYNQQRIIKKRNLPHKKLCQF